MPCDFLIISDRRLTKGTGAESPQEDPTKGLSRCNEENNRSSDLTKIVLRIYLNGTPNE